MEVLTYLSENFNLDITIIFIVLLSGFFQKRYMPKWTISKDDSYDSALKTLLVSLIATALYIFFATKSKLNEPIPYMRYFISYFAATSLYELIINPFVKMLKKKFGEDEVKEEVKP
jgi:hypothetical protein